MPGRYRWAGYGTIQKPLVCVSDETRVRFRLEGEVDSRWCGTYNELATQQSVPAEAMSCSTKKEDGSGFESHGVLVVRLPLSVQSFEADSILDKAEGLIRQADLVACHVWDTVSGHLRNVFTKLAINSRVELVRIVDLNKDNIPRCHTTPVPGALAQISISVPITMVRRLRQAFWRALRIIKPSSTRTWGR